MNEENEVTVDIDNTDFAKQFSQVNNELSPIIMNFLEENEIDDNVMVFYFAGVIKEYLTDLDDGIKQAVLRFMFD